MGYRIAVFVVGIAVVVTACTTATDTPATAPTVPLPPTTVQVSPSSTIPVTTVPAPTTTLDRLAEIEAIYQDLEDRRVAALWSGDAEAFLGLFVDNPYKEESKRALEEIEPGEPPQIIVKVLKIVKDEPDCLVFVDESSVVGLDEAPDISVTTLQPIEDGWGYAYVSSEPEGWLCEEPHPLSG